MVGQVCDECRAAVLQLDLVGFTRMSARLPHMRLAQMVKETSLSSSDFKLNSWPYKNCPHPITLPPILIAARSQPPNMHTLTYRCTDFLFSSTARYRQRVFLRCAGAWGARLNVISPDFSLELTGFFPGKHLIHFFGAQDEEFSEFRSR